MLIVAELPDVFDAPAYSDLFEAMKKAEQVQGYKARPIASRTGHRDSG